MSEGLIAEQSGMGSFAVCGGEWLMKFSIFNSSTSTQANSCDTCSFVVSAAGIWLSIVGMFATIFLPSYLKLRNLSMSIMSRFFILQTLIFSVGCFYVSAKEMAGFDTLENCKLVKTAFNDGDSFEIRVPDRVKKDYVIRLYGIDTMETNDREDYMKQRLKEQALYFGLHTKDTKRNPFKVSMKLGDDATAFTKKALQRPFTVKTKYVNAMGKQRRIYAYVITSDGKDLGELLVKAGLARVYGRVDNLPDVQMPYEYRSKLKIHEIQSIRGRAGAWRWTDWREFEAEREEYRQHISKLNVNSMENNAFNIKLIVFRTGVSAKVAKALLTELKNGPYKSIKDLDKRVKGVGKSTAKKLGKVLVFE